MESKENLNKMKKSELIELAELKDCHYNTLLKKLNFQRQKARKWEVLESKTKLDKIIVVIKLIFLKNPFKLSEIIK